MSQIRVNIKHRVANASIREEVRDGRTVKIIPSAVAKFDTVLNGIFYPRAELEASYLGLNRTYAPLGHPVVGGKHVSADDPVAVNQFHIGAHNENARIEGDRIMADVVLDVEYAKRHPQGERLIDAINAGKPINTSTGLYMDRKEAPQGLQYNYIGTDYIWNHNAILLDEAPAIGTESGVGLMVNAQGDSQQVEVINSELELNDELPGSADDMRRILGDAVKDKFGDSWVDDFNADSLIFYSDDDNAAYKVGYATMDGKIVLSDDKQKVERKTTWEAVANSFKATLSKMFGASPDATPKAPGLNVNSDTQKDIQMTSEELQAALDKQAETLQANFDAKLSEAIKPLHEQIEANAAADKAKVEAERTQLATNAVKANILTQEEADALDVNALRILERNSKKAAGGIAGGLHSNTADESTYDTLPE